MKELHNLITNTTSLVGYIAVLMFAGAYLGGDKSATFDPTFLKGSVMESRDTPWSISVKPVIVTIDGHQYEAIIRKEADSNPAYQY